MCPGHVYSVSECRVCGLRSVKHALVHEEKQLVTLFPYVCSCRALTTLKPSSQSISILFVTRHRVKGLLWSLEIGLRLGTEAQAAKSACVHSKIAYITAIPKWPRGEKVEGFLLGFIYIPHLFHNWIIH